MKALKTLFLILIISIGLIGCGNSEKKTKLKVSFGAVTGSAQFPGGLYLMANSDNGQKFIQQVPPGDFLDLELLNGNWDFAVIGWDGSASAYSGNSFCDNIQGMPLTGGDFNISLNATKGKCSNFSSSDSLVSQNFAPLKFYSCMDIKPHLDIGESVDAGMDCNGGGDGGGTGPGGDISFKISILTKTIEGTIGNGLSSECVNGPGTLGNVSFPYGSANAQVPVKVTAFTGAGCTGNSTEYFFVDGLSNNAQSNLAQTAINQNTSVNIYLHVDICQGAQLTAQPFAASYGNGGSYHLICTANQFVNIGSNSTQYDKFELGQNIDFSQMTNPSATTYAYIGTSFGGELRGKYKSVLNGDRALFNVYKDNPSDRNYTGNLVIDNFNLNFAGGSTQSFGIFANRIENYGTEDLEVGNIHILRNSSIHISGSVSGYIGAFAGKIDHNNTSGNSYIRRVQSLADVSTTNTASTSQYVGGLIGKVLGNVSNDGNGVSLELNDVGIINIPYLNNFSDTKKVNITGFKNVGGIAGAVYQADLRGYNTADTRITSYGDTGGIVGTVLVNNSNSSFQMAAVKSKLEFIPADDPVHNVGGIIGEFYQSVSNSSGGSFFIAAAVSDFDVPATGASIHYLGGVIGKYDSVGSADLKIYNSKANLSVLADGDYHGGIVGSYYAPTVNPGLDAYSFPAISYSLAQGYLGNSLTTGEYRGGLVGKGTDADIYRSIANMDIYGEARMGGAIGSATDSVVYESFLQGLVEATGTSSTYTFAGGAIGELVNTVNTGHITFARSKVRFNINYNSVDLVDCNGAQCGLVVGGVNSSHNSSISFSSIAVGAINDTGGALVANNCGSQYGTTCPPTFGGFSTSFATQSSEASLACAALGGGEPFDLDAGICTPLFEKRWKEYGFDSSQVGLEYVAGNQLEPFGISSVADWDNLSDDSFLMAKSYELKDYINFGGGSPNSIGSAMNPFNGSIYPGNFELQNINFTATPGKTGVISYMKSGASIGHFMKSLKVDVMTINCGTESNCGFIGQIGNDGSGGGGDAEVNIRISGGNISGSSGNDCTGGIIGKTVSSARFNNSSFQGAIDIDGYGVGGFIGCVSSVSGSGGSFDGPRIDFDESFVDLDNIIGSNYVGGFIGEVQNTSSAQTFIKFKDSYVVLDKNAVLSGGGNLGINATSGLYASGLIGAIDLNTSKFEVEEVYVDTSTAKIPSFYRPISRKTAGTIDGNDRFENIGLIWNSSTSSAGTFYNLSDSVPQGSGISFDVNSVSELITAGSNSNSGSSFEASAESNDHGDWYYPVGARVLKLSWEAPNYVNEF